MCVKAVIEPLLFLICIGGVMNVANCTCGHHVAAQTNCNLILKRLAALQEDMNKLDVWNPYLQKNMNTLEDVQKVALRMCSKYCDKAYCSSYCSSYYSV